MYLIVGLGNPGPEYSKTRHNVGFWVIEALAERWKIDLSKKKFKSHYGEGFFQNEKVILSLPQTFMNLSGESVAAMTDFYKIPLDQLIVIHDEMDLEIGRLKVVREGGPAGHRGVASIQQLLATQSFCRFRIGIGKPSHKTKTNGFVLGEFSEDEEKTLEAIIHKAVEGVEIFIQQDVNACIQFCHQRK